MAAYPLKSPTYRAYLRLSQHITTSLLERVLPNDASIDTLVASGDEIPGSAEKETKFAKLNEDKQHKNHGFAKIDIRRSFRKGATGAEITEGMLDKTWLLEQLLLEVYKTHDELLGELELSFLCLLIGQNFAGLEQWKTFLELLCCSEKAILKYTNLYLDFFGTKCN